jgi:glycosyltransferase involved in cell wall biosynthesis
MPRVISVIVSTSWKSNQSFFKMLPLLDWSYSVGEVIIIDNNMKETPKDDLKKYNKLLRIPSEVELSKSQSFNLGVKASSNEIICFLDDDVIFDPRIFEFVSVAINQECGIILPHSLYLNRPTENEEMIQNLYLHPADEQTLTSHCALLLKKNFMPLPEDENNPIKHISQNSLKHALHNWMLLLN